MNSLTVYCASADGIGKHYHHQARTLGEQLASNGYGLVYGGGSVGLMGTLARNMVAAGGEVVGVITRRLQTREIGFEGCKELIIVENMQERRKIMMDRGDGFIALPGGVGTLEEFFEVVVGRVVGEHQKPVALLDVDSFFDPLIALLQHNIDHGFVRPSVLEMLLREEDPARLLHQMVCPPKVTPEQLMPEIYSKDVPLGSK